MKKPYRKPSVLIVKTQLQRFIAVSEHGNAVSEPGTSVNIAPGEIKSGGNTVNAAARGCSVWDDDE